MDFLINFIYRESAWLYNIIYQNDFFFIDFWTFNHLWSGAFLYLIILISSIRRRFVLLLSILVGYEIIEISFRIFALDLFRPEIIKDQITDIIVGTIGALISHTLIEIKNKFSLNVNNFGITHPLTSFIAAATISYLWVGFYGYNYNMTAINFDGFSIAAFLFWLPSLYGIIQIYEFFERKKRNSIFNPIIVWMIYFPALLIIEFISYYEVGLKEIGHGRTDNDMIFGVIHGTSILHAFYILAPFLVMGFYKILTYMKDKAANRIQGNDLIIISRQP